MQGWANLHMLRVQSVLLKPKSKARAVWYDRNCCSFIGSSPYQISSHPFITLQNYKSTIQASMAWTHHAECIISLQCSRYYWVMCCTRWTEFINGSFFLSKSLQTTQYHSFKRLLREGVKPTWEAPSIERVSLYEQVKKSPWVLSPALFSGKMVPWAAPTQHSCTLHHTMKQTRWISPHMLHAINSTIPKEQSWQ